MSLIHFELIFCTWHKVRVQINSFACEYPVFLTPFVKKTTFPLSLGILVKDYLIISRSCISWLYSIQLVYILVFMPVPHCFDYYSFTIRFEMRNCETSKFVLLSEDYLLFS